MFHCIKQLEEKPVATEIDLLVWSDRMDLVALSNIKGEVSLHRLTWARALNLGPCKEGITVKGLAWKPDGKIIAIGYSTKNKAIINKLDVSGEISYMYWVQEKALNKNSKLSSDQEEQMDYLKYLDYSAIFLPDPPPLSSFGSSNISEENLRVTFRKQTELNMLVVGTMEEELNFLHATIKDQLGTIKIVIINTSIFKTHTRELFAVSMKQEYLKALLNYLSTTISVIKETWENILMEMDAKLSKYASKVPEGTLATDFLDLLMFGITTEHMQEFLLHDLTKKGLEKFGQTIEMSYANIQKLLLKNVTKVGQNITYHLAELRGMARLEYRYKILGLMENEISEAILASGAFLNKSGEMQQIINTSMINYKAFFRWLYSAIIHLVDEQVSPEIPKMTQQDIAHITEFLLNFDDIGTIHSSDGTTTPKFVMEKLGQYLANEPLTIPSEIDTNEWNTFLDQNECIKNNPSILKHFKETSLIQQFNFLKESISNIFDKLFKFSLVDEFEVSHVLDVMNFPHPIPKITNISCGPSTVLFGLLLSNPPSPQFYFLEINTGNTIHVKCDLQFYTTNILSLLLQENNAVKTAVIYQCPVIVLREKIVEVSIETPIFEQDVIKINANSLGNSVSKTLDGMVASSFAVSGFRNVSVVLADNKRKVRIFEMEAEEDEEEDAEMTNSTVRESDVSMPENSDGD
ncbi:hypothetical protein Trydic_g6941 [Trypoxylus dichotomus]